MGSYRLIKHLRQRELRSVMNYYCFSMDSSYSPIDEERRCPSLEKEKLDNRNKIWLLGWCWISAKKRACLGRDSNLDKQDLGMNCGKICWRQLFWKARSELRKMIASRPSQGFKYDALSYALNFDDGCWQDQEEHYCYAWCGGDHGNGDPLEP